MRVIALLLLSVVAFAQTTVVNGIGTNGAPLISSNTTLTVAASGAQYTSVQAALTALGSSVIDTNAFVTISVAAGTYSSNTVTLVQMPHGQNLTIAGPAPISTALTSVQSSTGSAGAWTLVLNLSSVAGISTGNYVAITSPAGGTNPTYLAGLFPVTNVDAANNRITVTSTHHAAAAPSGSVTGTVRAFSAILSYTGADGFDVWNGASIINLKNIVLVGDGTHAGLNVQDLGRAYISDYIGVYGWATGVEAIYSSELNGAPIIAGNCTLGFYAADSGNMNLPYSIASGGSTGFEAAAGGTLDIGNATSTGNLQYGFQAINNSALSAPNSTATGNSTAGYQYYYTTFSAADVSTWTASGNGTTLDATFGSTSTNLNTYKVVTGRSGGSAGFPDIYGSSGGVVIGNNSSGSSAQVVVNGSGVSLAGTVHITLPTSCTGLSSGNIFNNSGTIAVCP